MVSIYCKQFLYDGGYSRNISTSLYPLYNFSTCIANYFGKIEQYGDDDDKADETIIAQHVKFSRLTTNSLEIIATINRK
jgi:hypothetical protein